MKFTYGNSKSGNVSEAAASITNPKALFFAVAEADMLAKAAEDIEQKFPGVPAIGGVGQSYTGTQSYDAGVTIMALNGNIEVAADVLEQASVMPAKYIKRLETAFASIGGEAGNSACFDICSAGADVRAVTTLASYLRKNGMELAGGTSNSSAVACNGKVYEDACAFLAIKNLDGRIMAFKENIYEKAAGRPQMMVTDADHKNYKLCTLDEESAESVYCSQLGIKRSDMQTQTFKNPFGHICDNHTYIVSIKDVDEDGNIITFRPVNQMDLLTILEIGDIREATQRTLTRMKNELGRVSAVLSVNCLFRYILFHDEQYWDDYLAEMSREISHAGMVGVGEHFDTQFVNQTMCCLAFE